MNLDILEKKHENTRNIVISSDLIWKTKHNGKKKTWFRRTPYELHGSDELLTNSWRTYQKKTSWQKKSQFISYFDRVARGFALEFSKKCIQNHVKEAEKKHILLISIRKTYRSTSIPAKILEGISEINKFRDELRRTPTNPDELRRTFGK